MEGGEEGRRGRDGGREEERKGWREGWREERKGWREGEGVEVFVIACLVVDSLQHYLSDSL